MGLNSGLGRFVAVVYLVAAHVVLGSLVYERLRTPAAQPYVADPTEETPSHTPEPQSTPCAATAPEPPPIAESIPPSSTSGSIIIPVEGMKPNQLTDTFSAARAGGKSHDAIDIMASGGTPVMAAVRGKIVKFFDSVLGGITIYQASEDGKYIYYYAHLQRRADDLKEGDEVEQGRVIAYVGDTGNAGPGNYHLHFSIARTDDPKRYWTGTYINPFPFLKSGAAPN